MFYTHTHTHVHTYRNKNKKGKKLVIQKHMLQKRSWSARELRIALYKNDHDWSVQATSRQHSVSEPVQHRQCRLKNNNSSIYKRKIGCRDFSKRTHARTHTHTDAQNRPSKVDWCSSRVMSWVFFFFLNEMCIQSPQI